jgi:hypothetical protein
MKLGPSIAALGVITSASWLARAQPPEEQPMTAPQPPPPPVYEATLPSSSGEVPEPTVMVRTVRTKGMAAPRDALELSFATGYTQGFGSLSRGVGLPSVATAGVGFDLSIGYRINAHWAVLWTGEYQEFTAQRSDTAGGVTNMVGAQYHFAPTSRTDPWAELGAGYRYLWESNVYGPTVQWHGFQYVHVRLGLDVRTSEEVAIGPVIGADMTEFRWRDLPYYSVYIHDARLSTFVYAGVQGRFDLGGGRTNPTYQVYAKE